MEHCNAKQSDILHAAIAEFAKCGVMGTTMEQIAKSAQVSKRTLYKHYANKDELFDEVVELQLNTIRRLKDFPYHPNMPLFDQLKLLAKEVIKLTQNEDYLTLSRIVIIESMRSKEAADRVNVKFTDCEKGLTGWFSYAEKAGALGELTAKTAGTMFYGSIKQLIYWEQAIKWQPPLPQEEIELLIDQVCHVFSFGLSPKTLNKI
ncbi:TetR/AcrR family transcriptional regulator [Psychrosphaera sp. F3M07]|uniref:TetR/AcrR family transcriptional regulator n=1 Tax=Psychrosphaera sp. F3M07 TaxID=2841560 RepID=UPI001C08756F|nr:TetR/AcrR family transcriptional regulator [Psychrosphaera sp. F3M07]MBU2917347.1 TetR/AcrR family transcriptional regulator [Psychrosphaera sp. F3M07]